MKTQKLRKFAIAAIIVLSGLMACRKTVNRGPSVPPVNSVTADVNDSSMSFNAEITVDTTSTPGIIYIVAHADSANFTPLLEITLVGARPLKTGMYTDAPDSLNNGTQGLLGYTAWASAVDHQFFNAGDTVTLTSVTNLAIAGTFQGTCQYTANAQGDSVSSIVQTLSITNGRFQVGLGQQ